MGAHKKQRIFNILAILTMAVILTCIFAACGDTGAQNPSNDNGNNGNGNVATPYIRFVVDDIEYSKVQTRGNEIIVMPANPTKDGYTFVGWFWDKGTWERPFTANSMLNEPLKSDMAVYAYFEKVHEHTYSAEWTYDATNHWHASTCGHSVVDGKETHVFNNVYKCTVCGYEDVSLHGTDIETNTLTLENNNISGKVPNNQEVFSFIEEIAVADGATFTVSTDINGSNVIRTKTVNLAIGDNTYYILVENGKDIKLYNVSIRRRPVYTVTFDTAGGTEVQAQQVEEDCLATEPTTERVGYDFVEWNYDFSKSIVKDEIVVATWNIVTYKITYDLNGGENPSTNPSTYTVEDDEIILLAPIMTEHVGVWSNGGRIAKGSTGNKHFVASYTINQYNVTVLPSNCEINGDGMHDIASSITLSATPYLGYDFVGWYDGDTLLSKENTYVFTMPAGNLTITAKTAVRADMQNFAFSSTIDSCTITGLKDKSITELTIPDYVTSIGSGAFKGCSSLTSITIPFVGAKAGLTSSSKYQYPFGYIFGTSNYTGGVATEQYYYGSSTSSTTSTTYYIPSSLKSVTVTGGNILYGAFDNCSGLTSVTIGNAVTSIGESAFRGCSGLTSVTIGSGVTSIVKYAFYNCTGLTNVTIPDSVTSIGYSAFSGCSGLTSITIPDSVTSIGGYAFYGCTGLTSVTIGNSVTSIGAGAFYNCSGLTSVTIPDSVTSIGWYAFSGCSGLTNVSVDSGNTRYHSEGNCIIETESKRLILGCKNSVIPTDGSVTSIGEYAFRGCTDLTSVTIPDSVTSIGDGAFYNCTGLTSVTIGNSVTSIGDYAFSGCTGLRSVTIGNSVTSIGDRAFYCCTGLTSVTIGNSVTSIGDYAFRGCTDLTSVTIPDSVTSIGDGAFYNCTGLTSVTIGNSVTSIGDYAFYNCSGLTGITIPDGVTSIGYSTFSGCTGLTSISIPDSMTSIDNRAFEGCTGLTNVSVDSGNTRYHSEGNCIIETESKRLILGCKNSVIPTDGSVTSIGGFAFSGCTGLTSVIIPDSVTSIGDYAFYNCSGLTGITIPDGVTSIGYSTFSGCTGLTSVTIPDSVTSIGSSAFYGCSGLTNITIPNGVTSIGYWAFFNCTELTSITFNGTKAQWNAISKGSKWNYDVPSTCKIVCTDGTIK